MSPKLCILSECARVQIARGLCARHYSQMSRQGRRDEFPIPSISDRLTSHLVRMPNGCLEWTDGCTSPDGYGVLRVNGKSARAHRVAWELTNGPILNGLQVLHRCDNPPCCDVEHLWLGTNADNNADMMAKGRQVKASPRTHCHVGHEFSEVNTAVGPTGHRKCRTCMRLRSRKYKAAQRVRKGQAS